MIVNTIRNNVLLEEMLHRRDTFGSVEPLGARFASVTETFAFNDHAKGFVGGVCFPILSVPQVIHVVVAHSDQATLILLERIG